MRQLAHANRSSSFATRDHGRVVGTLQRAPMGLDIGVRRHQATALWIAAEIERRLGGQLTEIDLPVHCARPPASTTS